MGQSPPSNTYNSDKKGLPFFQGKAEFGKLYPTPIKYCSKPKKIAEEGDILLSVRAPVGSTNINKYKSCIGRGLAAIRPVAGIQSKYILYVLRTNEQKLNALGTGTTFKAISKKTLHEFKCCMPPLDEQNRIVEKTEELFSSLDKATDDLKKIQGQLKTYRQSVLKAAFEGKYVNEFKYKMMKLGDFERKGGGTPSTKKEEYWNGNINWITSANIDGNNKIHFEKKITEIGLDNSSTNIVPKDSVIVVTRVGLGKVAVNQEATAFSQDIQGIVCRELNPYFLMWQIKSVANEIISKGQGTTINGITVNKLNEIEIKIPTKNIQNIIVKEIESRLSVCDKLEETVEQSLKKNEYLRQSILKQAFEGKLVPQDSNDEPVQFIIEKVNQEKLSNTIYKKKYDSIQTRLV